jgi:hypothetical protein
LTTSKAWTVGWTSILCLFSRLYTVYAPSAEGSSYAAHFGHLAHFFGEIYPENYAEVLAHPPKGSLRTAFDWSRKYGAPTKNFGDGIVFHSGVLVSLRRK